MTSKPNILILYPVENDAQATILYEEVMNKGGYPLFLPFNLTKNAKYLDIAISKNKLYVNEELDSIKAVFIRGVSIDLPLAAPPYLSELELQIWKSRYIKENQKINSINQIIKILEGRGVLIANSIRTYFHHNTKVQLASYLRSQKLPMPRTFGTNSANDLNKKIKSKREYVMKSACGVGATRLLTEDHLNKHDELRYCPMLGQERIEGETIRVHTIGNKAVLSLRIFATDVDSRTDTAGFEVIELIKKHEEAIIKANEKLGLVFSAWDVIVDKKGRLYLLDCNPGPYIYWIGAYFTRLFMAEVAKYLVTYVKTGSIDEAELSTRRVEASIGQIHNIEAHLLPHIGDMLHEWKKTLGLRH